MWVSFGPVSRFFNFTDQINTTKLVLHQQMFNEASVKKNQISLALDLVVGSASMLFS
jgi:hypothetical protein